MRLYHARDKHIYWSLITILVARSVHLCKSSSERSHTTRSLMQGEVIPVAGDERPLSGTYVRRQDVHEDEASIPGESCDFSWFHACVSPAHCARSIHSIHLFSDYRGKSGRVTDYFCRCDTVVQIRLISNTVKNCLLVFRCNFL